MRGGSWYDTEAKFKINEGAGKEFVAIGDTMAKLGKQQEDKVQQDLTNNYNKTMLDLNVNKDKREAEKVSLDTKKEQYILDELSKDKNKATAIEDGMIKAYEKNHPIYMGVKTKDGTDIPEYSNMTREDKLALIKLAGDEQNNKNTPKVVDVTTSADGTKMAIFSDGTSKDLGFKAKTDWNTPKQKELSYQEQLNIGETLTKQRIEANKKKSELAGFNIE